MIPEHRQIRNGRTFSSAWDASQACPIERFDRMRSKLADALFAIGLGIAGAVVLAWGLCK